MDCGLCQPCSVRILIGSARYESTCFVLDDGLRQCATISVTKSSFTLAVAKTYYARGADGLVHGATKHFQLTACVVARASWNKTAAGKNIKSSCAQIFAGAKHYTLLYLVLHHGPYFRLCHSGLSPVGGTTVSYPNSIHTSSTAVRSHSVSDRHRLPQIQSHTACCPL